LNVSISLDNSSKNFREAFKTVWEIKRSSAGKTLVSYQMIHPGSEQQIAVWEIGKAEVSSEVLEILSRGENLPPDKIGARFRDVAVGLRIKVYSRDTEPFVFDVIFTDSEIERFASKTFDPVSIG
jgi:hypothetical protein